MARAAGHAVRSLGPAPRCAGCGKTTLAQLFEFPTLWTLLRNEVFGHKDLVAALSPCGAIQDDRPRILGCRLPLETDYRDFWEFPYADDSRLNLMTALLQARAVLAWFRHLHDRRDPQNKFDWCHAPNAQSVLDTIGGIEGDQLAGSQPRRSKMRSTE